MNSSSSTVINKNEIMPRVPSLKAAEEYIYQMDLSKVIDKLSRQPDWNFEDANYCSHLYRNYLYLVKKYSDQLPPSKDIDEFWHQHILDTQKYHQDCQAIFGRYLHHYPYFGIDEETDQKDLEKAFDKTQEYYYKEFGEYL